MAPKAGGVAAAGPPGPPTDLGSSQSSATLKPPTAAETVVQKLQQQKRNGRAVWWTTFEPMVFVAADGTQQAVLKCTECCAHLATSNPAVICGGHLPRLRALHYAAEMRCACGAQVRVSWRARDGRDRVQVSDCRTFQAPPAPRTPSRHTHRGAQAQDFARTTLCMRRWPTVAAVVTAAVAVVWLAAPLWESSPTCRTAWDTELGYSRAIVKVWGETAQPLVKSRERLRSQISLCLYIS
jgi:hypothetical protein